MKVTLATPYTVGDLNPDVTYPHVYITTFFVNGPARSATIQFEVGTLTASDDPMGLWSKAPEVPSMVLNINGADLYPFFGNEVASGINVSPYLWDQVESLLYAQIQAANPRLAGSLA